MPDVKRDARYNSSDGKARQAPDSKMTGARLVAQVMTAAEARAGDGDRLGEPPGVRFSIGENQAKKINHDAAPK
jgi:hypothetical protein